MECYLIAKGRGTGCITFLDGAGRAPTMGLGVKWGKGDSTKRDVGMRQLRSRSDWEKANALERRTCRLALWGLELKKKKGLYTYNRPPKCEVSAEVMI